MHRQIAVSLVTLVLAISVRSDQNLKCYMCTSLTNEGCATDPEAHKLEPVECTLGRIGDFQRSLQQHNLLNPVSSIFEVDTLQSHQSAAPRDMACAKMVLKIANQDVTVRNCQTAKTETIDPCKALVAKLPADIFQQENCNLCMHDACNHSGALTPRVFFVVLSVLGGIGLGTLFRAA